MFANKFLNETFFEIKITFEFLISNFIIDISIIDQIALQEILEFEIHVLTTWQLKAVENSQKPEKPLNFIYAFYELKYFW